MKKGNVLCLVAVLSMMFMAGCATTPTIGYENKSPRQASKNVSVYLESFEDGRTASEKGILGGMYNGYNMRGGNVMEPPRMIESLKNTFKSELQAAGYNLVEDKKDLSIKATLISLTCDTRINADAAINLRVVLVDKGNEIFSKAYAGQASVFQLLGSDTSGAINQSIKKTTEQLIKDLDEYIST